MGNYDSKKPPYGNSEGRTPNKFNRDDSRGNHGYASFTKDKRPRTGQGETGHVSYPDRNEREQRQGHARTEKRSSFNPNFTRDNKPVQSKPYGSRNANDRTENPDRPYGNRPKNNYDSRSVGDRPERKYGDRTGRPSSQRPDYNNADKSDRNYGDTPKRYGSSPARKYGSEGPKPYGSQKKYGEPRYGKPETAYGRTDKPFTAGEPRTEGFASRKPFSPGNKPGVPRTGRKFESTGDGGSRTFRQGKPASGKGFKPHRDSKEYPKFPAPGFEGGMRLNRYIAQSGICSRREADDFIQAGVVSVNGSIVTELGTKVLPTDVVKFNDSTVQSEKKVYIVMNKPKGFVTTVEDPHADKTVMDLVKNACTERVYPVGRLDKNSVGVLLITNDGDLARQLTHPGYRKKKIYQVSLDKPLTKADMEKIALGITLEDGEIYADEISYVDENKKEIGIEIHSGRNRIVRRIFESLGYGVTKLDRVYFAGITKQRLKRGAWRFLSPREVAMLKSGEYE